MKNEIKEEIKELKKEILKDFQVNLTDGDLEVLLKKMSLDEIRDSLNEGDIHFEKNMTETIQWQTDDYASSSKLLEQILNLEINRDFLDKYIEAGCNNLADYVSEYIMNDDGERIVLKESVAYIYG